MEQWLQLIGNTGFPIVVTMYLMHRIEGKLDVLIQVMHSLPARMYEEGAVDRISRVHISDKAR
ncbi:YvrJ family protein [Bacillus mangrovi]|uniref:YvrJ family protein n=1 Tax=Metabacillus mangrovi TaxID=1491830 RepID=A0A7X2V4I5_9BACI|nr:YvrJ family protein [Metabacillus mangrovi]MTH53144.1 YvrJ family protein [Metabacillus mangrovi]